MRRINDGGYMKETIGNVLLNLDYYDGEDAYSDGSIEDRLLEIVKTTPKEDYQKVILTEKSWPIFYHLSPERENILDWYEWKDDASVFESSLRRTVTPAAVNFSTSSRSLSRKYSSSSCASFLPVSC